MYLWQKQTFNTFVVLHFLPSWPAGNKDENPPLRSTFYIIQTNTMEVTLLESRIFILSFIWHGNWNARIFLHILSF